MKATAKYLFDEDFASGEKPTITMVEHERRRADAEFRPIGTDIPPGRNRRSRKPPNAWQARYP